LVFENKSIAAQRKNQTLIPVRIAKIYQIMHSLRERMRKLHRILKIMKKKKQ